MPFQGLIKKCFTWDEKCNVFWLAEINVIFNLSRCPILKCEIASENVRCDSYYKCVEIHHPLSFSAPHPPPRFSLASSLPRLGRGSSLHILHHHSSCPPTHFTGALGWCHDSLCSLFARIETLRGISTSLLTEGPLTPESPTSFTAEKDPTRR